MALVDKLKNIGDAIRAKTGGTELLTLDEMVEQIDSLEEEAQTYILVDEDGNEIPAVMVDEPVTLTATANDIREGTVAITDAGVITGEKFIPPYYTSVGKKLVRAGSEFSVYFPMRNAHDYTSLQCIICMFNTSMNDSVSAEKVVIDDKVYETNSTIAISSVVKDHEAKTVRLGITNESDKPYIIRYFTYKEEE